MHQLEINVVFSGKNTEIICFDFIVLVVKHATRSHNQNILGEMIFYNKVMVT